MSPVRIQRRREKGWRMPENTVYVGRPTKWGNNVRASDCEDCNIGEPNPHEHVPYGAAGAVELFRYLVGISPNAERWAAPLRGLNLACWCPLDQPCHADVLLELANPATERVT